MHGSMFMSFAYSCRFCNQDYTEILAVPNPNYPVILHFSNHQACVEFLSIFKNISYSDTDIFHRRKKIKRILDVPSELVNLELITMDVAEAFYYTRLY